MMHHGRTPPDYLFPPALFPGNEVVLELFWELSTDRPASFSSDPCAIPAMAINMALLGYDRETAAELRYYLRAMDAVVLRPPLHGMAETQPDAKPDVGAPDAARDSFRLAMRKGRAAHDH